MLTLNLNGVIFDLGGTLVTYHPELEQAGADALRAFLLERGYAMPPAETFRARNQAQFAEHLDRLRQGDTHDMRAEVIYAALLAELGIPREDITPDFVEAGLWAYFERFRQALTPKPGAVATLAALRQRDLRVGLISNSYWPARFFRPELARWGYLPHLEFTIFSCDPGVWKPDPVIFHLGLAALGLAAGETVYVGDSPYFDIHGAQNAGLRAVLIGGNHWESSAWLEAPVEPDAAIEALPDLLAVVDGWRGKS